MISDKLACYRVQRAMSALLDGSLAADEQRAVSLHVNSCAECHRRRDDLRSVRYALGALSPRVSPRVLTTRLRVVASHEKARVEGNGEFSTTFQRWLLRLRLRVNDLMRPLAVPAAGGILSSILFFTMLVDTFAVQQPTMDDIPLGISTQVTVDELSPFGFTGRDLELTIDRDGRVVGYSAPSGALSREDMRQLGNLILFTSFNPARAYGQPTSGKVLVSHHRINVRG